MPARPYSFPLQTSGYLVLSLLLACSARSSDDEGSNDYDGGYGESYNDAATSWGSSGGTGSGGPSATSGGADYDDGGAEDVENDDSPDDTGLDTGAPEDCDTDSAVEVYLSPDDSNSMSSPVLARIAVEKGGNYLNSVRIRTWEFLNYYSFDYPAAEPGELAVRAQLIPETTGVEGTYELQLGVSSPELANTNRSPLNLTMVLDTSCSMGGAAIENLRYSTLAVASQLREGDIVSVVTWDTSNEVELEDHAVVGPNDPTLLAILENMREGGGTNLTGGLTAGYELAQRNYSEGALNRIMLVSDGGANAGITDIDKIAGFAGEIDETGIYMVGVGVGDGSSYNDDLMDQVTDAGRGASVFIDSEAEAFKIFGEQFVNTLDVASRDVQIGLTLPAGFEIVKFSGEEISVNKEDVEPQNIAPNDTMVFYQSIETCAPDEVTDESELTVNLTWRDAITFAEGSTQLTTTFGELLGQDHSLLL